MSRKPDSASAQAPASAQAQAGVRSPCIDVCRIDPRSGWCEGCQRTLDEIAQWASLPDAGKHEVLRRIVQRRDSLAAPAQEPASKDKR